jgi:hypothetical protein
MLNSAQHARSAASRLDGVIDRSALEQAREGLGGRDMEEAAHLDSESKKSTFEVRGPAAALHTIPTIATLPDCFSVPLDPNVWTSDNMSVTGCPPFGTLGLRDGKEPQRLIFYESSSLCS